MRRIAFYIQDNYLFALLAERLQILIYNRRNFFSLLCDRATFMDSFIAGALIILIIVLLTIDTVLSK